MEVQLYTICIMISMMISVVNRPLNLKDTVDSSYEKMLEKVNIEHALDATIGDRRST